MSCRRHPVLNGALLLLMVVVPMASAHVPQSVGENDSLQNAARIDNPTKSWAFYDDIAHAGQAKYYKLELVTGDRLYASVFLQDSNGFLPGLAAMGEGFTDEGLLPSFVEAPPGYGHIVLNATLGEREYEPFTPAAYYQICKVDIAVNRSGTYYIAVFDERSTGDFGIAIGYLESFTADEWLLIPFNVINIHIWEGQSEALIFAPLIAVIVGLPVALILARKRGRNVPSTVSFWFGAMVGALYIGTGAMTFLQMGIAASISDAGAGALVTLLFAILPVVLGYQMVRQGFCPKQDAAWRVKLALLGGLGLVLWAGLIIGPVMAFLMTFLPSKLLNKDLASKKAKG